MAGDPRDSFLWVWTPPALESQLQRPTLSRKPTLHFVTHRPGVGPLFSALGAAGQGRHAGPCFIPPAPGWTTVRPGPGPALRGAGLSGPRTALQCWSLLGPQGLVPLLWAHPGEGMSNPSFFLRAPWFSRRPYQPPSRDTVGEAPYPPSSKPASSILPHWFGEGPQPCGWGRGLVTWGEPGLPQVETSSEGGEGQRAQPRASCG